MQGKSINTLLIEDNPKDARLIQEELSEAMDVFFNLTCAETLQDGLKQIENGGIDIILLDLSLPDSTGLDTFSKVYEKAHRVPILILSGMRDELLAETAVGKGAQDYSVKSDIDRQLLIRSIQYAIERHKVRDELLKSQEQFRIIAENSTDLICVVNLEGKYLYNSPSYLNVVDNPNELLGTSFFNLIHTDDVEKIKHNFNIMVTTGMREKMEYRLVTKRLGLCFIESSGTVILDDKGKSEKIVIVSHDITEQKRVEEEIHQLSKEVQLLGNDLVEQTSESIIITNTNKTIEYVNSAFEHVTGYTKQEVINKPIKMLEEEKYTDIFFSEVEKTLQTGKIYKGEIINKKKNGEPLLSHTTITPLKGKNGEITHWIFTGRDITSIKQEEKKTT